MFSSIDLSEARRQRWDVILAGSSFSSMFFLHGLPAGLRVLIVEKGRIQSHEDLLANGISGAEEIVQDNRSGRRKLWVANSKFGGNSNCWWGQVPRFHPSDFRLATLYGQGRDWPIDYDTLEPDYLAAERIMEVAGDSDRVICPRSARYPYPAHQGSLTDRALWKALPEAWIPVASARSNGGTRPICCANGICRNCPIDAKFTILNAVGRFVRPGARLLTGTEIRAVDLSGGAATGVVVRDPGGGEVRIAGDLVALGANAVFNAAILLRSGMRNPALGRYLHEQTSLRLDLDIAVPNYFGASSITGHGYGCYDGPHRREAAAVLMENFNSPPSVRPVRGRWTHRMSLKLVAEDLPQAENRVELDAQGEARIVWIGHSAYGEAGLARAEARLPGLLPFEIEAVAGRRRALTEAHIQGTHRMGEDPAGSVVDARLRAHGVAGLYVLGAGAFPTSSAANPTLTLSALALRAGRLA